MGRPPRITPGDRAYHVLNRANSRQTIFQKPADYQAFEKVMAEAQKRVPMRILAYSVMPNHWHMVLWPRRDDQLSRFVGWLTLTHTQRWHTHYHNVGSGHLYQGRFVSFVIQEDDHLLQVCRYVERNPLRAKLARRAEDWRWGSLWRRRFGSVETLELISNLPVERPANWVDWANESELSDNLKALRPSANRGTPFGKSLPGVADCRPFEPPIDPHPAWSTPKRFLTPFCPDSIPPLTRWSRERLRLFPA